MGFVVHPKGIGESGGCTIGAYFIMVDGLYGSQQAGVFYFGIRTLDQAVFGFIQVGLHDAVTGFG